LKRPADWFESERGGWGCSAVLVDVRARSEGSGSTLEWKHVTEQIGMFCFSGMVRSRVSEVEGQPLRNKRGRFQRLRP
jgi:hypothetical protein